MTDLPALPRPYPYLRTGYLNAPALPAGIGTAVDLLHADPHETLRAGLDLVAVGAYEGLGIDEQMLTWLTACEAAGVPTLLHATAAGDLHGPTAAVVSHIATPDESLIPEVLARVGPERTFLVDEAIDARATLLQPGQDPTADTPQAIARRREALATKSVRAQAERLMAFLGLPVDPPPLVTVLLVARGTDRLAHIHQSLRRQQHPRIDPVLVINPSLVDEAQSATATWEVPVRVVPGTAGATLADRLNIGIQHAYGDFVAIFDERAHYGPYHLVDLIHAVEHSGAHIVGKASWFVYDGSEQGAKLLRPARQHSFGQDVALGSMLMHRTTARRFGFARRSTGINWPITSAVKKAGGTTYSIHSFDIMQDETGHVPISSCPAAAHRTPFPFSRVRPLPT